MTEPKVSSPAFRPLVIAVVFAGMAFTKWSSTTDYAPLYTNLSGADAGKVTQSLDSAGIKWTLADGGASVPLTADMGYTRRVDARSAAEGGPRDRHRLILATFFAALAAQWFGALHSLTWLMGLLVQIAVALVPVVPEKMRR